MGEEQQKKNIPHQNFDGVGEHPLMISKSVFDDAELHNKQETPFCNAMRRGSSNRSKTL
jgi:hypothetical protein